jgi:4-hydroxy-tetrahydrodipicolinate synthase
MTDKAFHGVFPYLVSPIRDDGAVDRAVLGRLCDDLIAAGVHGLTSVPRASSPIWTGRRNRTSSRR